MLSLRVYKFTSLQVDSFVVGVFHDHFSYKPITRELVNSLTRQLSIVVLLDYFTFIHISKPLTCQLVNSLTRKLINYPTTASMASRYEFNPKPAMTPRHADEIMLLWRNSSRAGTFEI